MAIIIFILGLVVGSFLNCVIYRLEHNKSFLSGRSFCPNCKHKLGFLDLIPVLSFLWLNGQCRYCKKPISLQYPLVELATGLLFVLMFRHFSFGLDLTFGFLISAFLVVIFVYDLKHYLIPDKIIYPAIGLTFLFRILNFGNWDLIGIWDLGFGILIAPIVFLAIIFISKGRWMGLGDVKLALLMGLLVGWPKILVALFFAFFSGAIIGVGLVLASKKSFKSEVPFGPFLVAGTLVAMFFGQELINWYLRLLYV